MYDCFSSYRYNIDDSCTTKGMYLMANKSEKRIVLDIKGRTWTFILMTDKAFDKLHNSNENPEENNNGAMTLPTVYEVHFRKTDWTLILIRHELGHVLYQMGLNGSTNHTPAQVEEAMCTIIGYHNAEIDLWADRICERFFED